MFSAQEEAQGALVAATACEGRRRCVLTVQGVQMPPSIALPVHRRHPRAPYTHQVLLVFPPVEVYGAGSGLLMYRVGASHTAAAYEWSCVLCPGLLVSSSTHRCHLSRTSGGDI